VGNRRAFGDACGRLRRSRADSVSRCRWRCWTSTTSKATTTPSGTGRGRSVAHRGRDLTRGPARTRRGGALRGEEFALILPATEPAPRWSWPAVAIGHRGAPLGLPTGDRKFRPGDGHRETDRHRGLGRAGRPRPLPLEVAGTGPVTHAGNPATPVRRRRRRALAHVRDLVAGGRHPVLLPLAGRRRKSNRHQVGDMNPFLVPRSFSWLMMDCGWSVLQPSGLRIGNHPQSIMSLFLFPFSSEECRAPGLLASPSGRRSARLTR